MTRTALVVTSTVGPASSWPNSILRPSPWSGWPAEWDTPLWSNRVDDLTDIAWACVDLVASLLSTMPPYLVGAAPSLDDEWLINPDPDLYTSWEEFAKQLWWDYQLGEAFVLCTARYSHGVAGPVPCRRPVARQRRDDGDGSPVHDRPGRRHRRHVAYPVHVADV